MKVLINRLGILKVYKNLNDTQLEAKGSILKKIQEGEYSLEHNTCVCGANNDIPIASTDRYGIMVCTKLCRVCGLMRSDPYYSPNTIVKFYENEYRPLYSSDPVCSEEFFHEQEKEGEKIYSFLQKYLSTHHRTIFDIGCGAGGILNFFKLKGFEGYGCDYGSAYLEYGKAKRLNLVCGGEKELERFGKADIIILNHVLEHERNPVNFLTTMTDKFLSRTGLIYIALPGIKSIFQDYFGDLHKYLQNAHVYHFTLNTLAFLASLASLALIVGNEKIQVVLRKEESMKPLSPSAENAVEVMEELMTLEFNFYEKIEKKLAYLRNSRAVQIQRWLESHQRLSKILQNIFDKSLLLSKTVSQKMVRS